MVDKELIWVSKETAKEFNAVDTEQEKERIIRKVINDKKIDIEEDLLSLDETVLKFRSACITHKNALEKVYHEQAEQLYKLWEDMGDFESKVLRHANQLAEKIKPITNSIEAINKDFSRFKQMFESVETYKIDRFLELANKVCNMDEANKNIMTFLLNNYSNSQLQKDSV